jgi:hypothetical protein
MQWDEFKLFEREAQVLKNLNHPRISKYRDYFSLDRHAGEGLCWFALVQNYIPGHSFQQLLDDSIPELGLGIETQTENYNYSIRTTPLTVFNYGVSRKNGIRSYVAGVFLYSIDEATGGTVTMQIMCESISPGISRPAEPVVRGNVIECDPSTKSLISREPIVLGQDAALAYNSLNYAAKGQYDQALEVTKTITDDSFKKMTLKAIAHSKSHPKQ